MKLRAPRCNDSVLLMSVSDFRRPISPSAANAAPALKVPMMIKTPALSMSRDPFRLRLHAFILRVPGHSDEKNKVQRGAHPGQDRINARWGLQPAHRQGNERYNKNTEHDFVDW